VPFRVCSLIWRDSQLVLVGKKDLPVSKINNQGTEHSIGLFLCTVLVETDYAINYYAYGE
jgi:hypothetical protein